MFYFTRNTNHAWNWNEIISAAERVLKLFLKYFGDIEHVGKYSWAAISLWNNFISRVTAALRRVARRKGTLSQNHSHDVRGFMNVDLVGSKFTAAVRSIFSWLISASRLLCAVTTRLHATRITATSKSSRSAPSRQIVNACYLANSIVSASNGHRAIEPCTVKSRVYLFWQGRPSTGYALTP